MNKKRPKVINFRLTEAETEILKNKIARSGKNQQAYLAACALQKNITNTDGLKVLLPELKRIGNNLNQITRVLNTTGQCDTKLIDENQKELHELWLLLRRQIRMLE